RRLCTLSGERGLCIRQRLLRFRHFSLGLFRLLLLLHRALLRVGCILILLLGVALRLLCLALLPIWRTRRTSKHEGGHGKQNPSHELLPIVGIASNGVHDGSIPQQADSWFDSFVPAFPVPGAHLPDADPGAVPGLGACRCALASSRRCSRSSGPARSPRWRRSWSKLSRFARRSRSRIS